MIKRYKIEYNQNGGAGAPIWFSTGTDFIIVSSFTTLNNLSEELSKENYYYMSKIKNQIDKYNNKISDFNSKYIISVTNKELKVLKFLLGKKLIY